MALYEIKAAIGACATAAVVLGLASCMQGGGRQVADVPIPTAAGTRPGAGLFFMDEGGSAKLAYGLANSDDVDLMLECAKGTGRVQVSQAVTATSAPKLTLFSAGQREDLQAQAQSGEGVSILVADTAIDAAPLRSFRRSGQLRVDTAGRTVGVIASANERVGVERFFAACERRRG